MKWLAFTGACVAGLVALGILAVDERDVVWEGRAAFCPYCRAPLELYAVSCKECARTLDWASNVEECRWCLHPDDAEALKEWFDSLGLKRDPLPGALAEFPIAYFEAIEAGACSHCGGLGRVLASGREAACPVCRERKRCIACGGDRTVVVGDAAAHRRALERAEEL
ncbi:MAG: hypothetical protein ACREID_04030, partial [Planctomycetota bacterium]